MANRRITKEMATCAAEDMKNAVYKEKLDNADAEINKMLENFVKNYFPAPVLACVAEYKKYFKLYNKVELRVFDKRDSEGKCAGGYKTIEGRLSFGVPNIEDGGWGWGCSIDVTKDECTEVVEADKNYRNLWRESASFYGKIVDMLLSLRTEKKVTEQFPEALPYIKFPDDKSNLPSPIFSDIRAMLQNVTSNKQ